MRATSWARGALVAAGWLLVVAADRPARAQGTYEPVTSADVAALKFNHYFTPDRRPHPATDFDWTFTPGRFTIAAKQGAIPAHLLAVLLPPGVTANQIEGRWHIAPDTSQGVKLVLTAIRAGGEKGRDQAVFPIYRTAPTVIRVGQPQHVFERVLPPAAPGG